MPPVPNAELPAFAVFDIEEEHLLDSSLLFNVTTH